MNKNFIILFFSGLIFISACKQNFDPQIYGKLSSTNFPSTDAEFELYTLELYKSFQSAWGYQGAVTFENTFYSPEYGHLVMFDASSDLMPVYSNWGDFWVGFSSDNFSFMRYQNRSSHFEKLRQISLATKIIRELGKASILSQARKDKLQAEARMARGTMMYYLLHIYGPVPVILDPALLDTEASADLTRPSRSTFVASIEADLRFAADHLELNPSEYGRFNKGAALTFLMRLYLNEKDFVKAESAGREILALNQYSLVADYADLFREATERNAETIWAVSCSNPGPGNFNPYAFYCYPADYLGKKIKGGWGGNNGVFSIHWKFYDTFSPKDTRRKLLVSEYSYTDQTGTRITRDRSNLNGAIIAKYPDEGGETNSNQGNDVVVCRYADVLLMLAEAINENKGPNQEAIDLINQVRKRANVDLLDGSESGSKENLREAIFMERGHELYFEGLRKMDLIRMGKWNVAYMGQYGKTPSTVLFPLPDYAINSSNGKLIQNEGY